MKVLVVENDNDIAEALADIIGQEGHETLLCKSGKEAISAFSITRSLDLVFCDLTMPGIGGLEVRQKMQDYPHLQQVPFILMSARIVKAEEIAKNDINDFLRKPFSIEEILKLLKTHQRSR